jgi:hypothetical protein
MFNRIFDQADRHGQSLLNGLSRLLVEGDQAARWAVMHLAKKYPADFRIVCVRNLIPHFPIRVAKPTVRAQMPGVEKRKNWTVKYGCLRRIRCALRGLGAVKVNLGVRAVTERCIM